MKRIMFGAIAVALLLGAGAVYAYVSPGLFKGEPLQARAVSTGSFSACAITPSNAAMCWGRNEEGQLGDGTFATRDRAAPVFGLNDGVTDIAVGSRSACAIQHGAVKCWGDNRFGALGDGTEVSSAFPVLVPGLEAGVTSIDQDGSGVCVVQSGGVKCWGLGVVHSPVPVEVPGLSSGIADVTVGDDHACVLTIGGEVGCWGDNSDGQLGDGTTTEREYPARVSGLPKATSISASENTTCAITIDGAAYCWGDNRDGQLGNGSATNSAVPVPVFGLGAGVALISVNGTLGGDHVCAVINASELRGVVAGRVMCWGENTGQFGNKSTASSFIPVPSDVHSAVSVSAGDALTCAVSRELVGKKPNDEFASLVTCWGVDKDVALVTTE